MCLGSKLTNKVKKLIIYFFQRSGDMKCVLKIAEYTHCTVLRILNVHVISSPNAPFGAKIAVLRYNVCNVECTIINFTVNKHTYKAA